MKAPNPYSLVVNLLRGRFGNFGGLGKGITPSDAASRSLVSCSNSFHLFSSSLNV
jgi:hypothetical protein